MRTSPDYVLLNKEFIKNKINEFPDLLKSVFNIVIRFTGYKTDNNVAPVTKFQIIILCSLLYLLMIINLLKINICNFVTRVQHRCLLFMEWLLSLYCTKNGKNLKIITFA